MAKKQAVSERGHAYILTPKGEKNLQLADMGGQAKVIVAKIRKSQPITAAKIVSSVAKQLQTKSEPSTIVAFYLAQFKRDGYLKFAPKTKAAASTSNNPAA
jgi:hypothetical protein